MNQISRIAIIIILYNSDFPQINDKNHIYIIVDNTPNRDLGISKENHIYIPLFKNKGIAAAQNIGIQKAISLNCEYVIFFDQDSLIPSFYINNMVNEYQRIRRSFPNLFILGPQTINGRTQEPYKSTIHQYKPLTTGFIKKPDVISSGSCVSISSIQDVGLLDESLFIDYVDHEWCWRAQAKGYICGITTNVKLTHFIGQNEYRILNQLVIVSSPIRYFYQTRNYMWLLRRKYVPLNWKIKSGIKRLIFPISYPFKTNNWKSIYINIYKGYIAGLKCPNCPIKINNQ